MSEWMYHIQDIIDTGIENITLDTTIDRLNLYHLAKHIDSYKNLCTLLPMYDRKMRRYITFLAKWHMSL